MSIQGESLKVFLNFIISLEDECMDEVGMLGPFEDNVGEVSEEGVE